MPAEEIDLVEWPDHCPAPPHIRRLANQVQSLSGKIEHLHHALEHNGEQLQEINAAITGLTSIDGPIAKIQRTMAHLDAETISTHHRLDELRNGVDQEERRRERADDETRDRMKDAAKRVGAGSGGIAGLIVSGIFELAKTLVRLMGGPG